LGEWAPKDIHILIPQTYEDTTFHGKRDFADVTMLRSSRGRWSRLFQMDIMSSQGFYKGEAGKKG
jgi:hypothetical protein